MRSATRQEGVNTIPLSGASWSPALVAAGVRHPMNTRMYAEAPYLAELYRDDLESRVVHPANLDKRDFAPPLLLHRGLKRWYLPGSADDLVLHTSCVVAC